MAGTKRAAPRKQTVKQIGRYVVADPKICHGALTFRGTRIFVSDVLEQVERGLPWDMIAEEWEDKVSQEAIAEAVKLARLTFLEHAPAGERYQRGDSRPSSQPRNPFSRRGLTHPT